MPRPQIKRTISSNFAVSKILDIVRAPYDIKTFCSSSHKSNWHRTASFFRNAVCALFISERHRAATGRTSGGDSTATGRRPHEHLSDFVPPSGCRTIYAITCVQPFVKIRHFSGIAENFE